MCQIGVQLNFPPTKGVSSRNLSKWRSQRRADSKGGRIRSVTQSFTCQPCYRISPSDDFSTKWSWRFAHDHLSLWGLPNVFAYMIFHSLKQVNIANVTWILLYIINSATTLPNVWYREESHWGESLGRVNYRWSLGCNSWHLQSFAEPKRIDSRGFITR